MTLDEFLVSAPLMLEAFANATRLRAESDPSMDPNKHRDPAWWWRDVAAYMDVTDIEELMQGRE
jgi:hypothetical protein